MQTFDLEAQGLRELNSTLHAQVDETNQTSWEITNPVSYTHLRAHET